MCDIRWLSPLGRSGTSFVGPCGGISGSSPNIELVPGWQTLEFEEVVSHSESPWRISLGFENGIEDGFEDCICVHH